MAYGSIDRQQVEYRRGLILGFTLAEIITLIIFCLLLALAARSLKERQVVQALRDEARAQVAELAVMKEKLHAFVGAKAPLDDLFKEIALLRQKSAEAEALKAQLAEVKPKAEQWDRMAAALQSRLPSGASPDAAADQLIQEAQLAAAIRNAMEEGGIKDPTPAQMAEAAKAVEDALKSALDASKPGSTPAEAIRQALAGREAMRTDNEKLRRQVGNLEEALRRVGPGTEMPPCWREEKTGRPEFIFDVALTTTGMVVRDRALPHRARDQAKLPIQAMTFNTEIPAARFQAEALALYNWSVENKCRFFVRAFDVTAPSQKKEYKIIMRLLETRFYKKEILDEAF
ncbi:hypothetical protein IP70_19900 [alpha proteobacterium AAP38]|nr:hypothetical protein IP70_19900 [alpha proteobacterium AAP38]